MMKRNTAAGSDGEGQPPAKRSETVEANGSNGRAAGAEAEDKQPASQAVSRTSSAESRSRLRFAVVCSSNMNRSMEAHKFLLKRGFDVKSYGTGSCVKLPGPAADKPNVYNFGSATYEQIYDDLTEKDSNLYTQNGVLAMLDRNKRIKPAPERFQAATRERFDVVITCESRIFDEVLKDLEDREAASTTPVHVVNLDIKDNHESATVGAMNILQLATMLQNAEDLDNDIQTVLEDFESKTKESVLHATAFY